MDSRRGFNLGSLRPLFAHALQRPYPALVASTSRFDTLADPRLLAGQGAIKFSIVPLLGRECSGFFSEIAGVVARPATQLATVNLDDTCGQALQKSTVVGDE